MNTHDATLATTATPQDEPTIWRADDVLRTELRLRLDDRPLFADIQFAATTILLS